MKIELIYDYEGEENTPINVASALINYYMKDAIGDNYEEFLRRCLGEVRDHLSAYLRQGEQ